MPNCPGCYSYILLLHDSTLLRVTDACAHMYLSITSRPCRPCRTLFSYCPPPALGRRKADMKTLSFFFPTPYPSHVHAQAAIKPRDQAQTSWSAELPVHVPCSHFFYALNMTMAGYVGVPCSYPQTLQNKGDHQQTLQNTGDHQQLQQLAHNNKTFEVGERSRFQSPESGPKHEAGRLARIIIM